MQWGQILTIMVSAAVLLLPGKNAQAFSVQSDFTVRTALQGPRAEAQLNRLSYGGQGFDSLFGFDGHLGTDAMAGTDYLLGNPTDVRASVRGLTKRVDQTDAWTDGPAVPTSVNVEANSAIIDDLLYGVVPVSEMQPIPNMSRDPWVENLLYDLKYPNTLRSFESLGFWGPSAGLWYPSHGFWYFSNGLWDPSSLWYVPFIDPYRQAPGFLVSDRRQASAAATPEPATLVLLGSGVLILLHKSNRR